MSFTTIGCRIPTMTVTAPASGDGAPVTLGELLTVREVSDLSGVPDHLLRTWKRRGTPKGPPPHKVGTSVMYRRADVDAWLAER